MSLNWIGALSAVALALTLQENHGWATTYRSTQLRDLAALSDGVVKGVIVDMQPQLDARGVPWVLYTISVDRMLAGEAASPEVTFRCAGGPLGNGHLLQMVGAPAISLGDSIVFLHASGDLCDVAGLEHGMFWIRNDSAGAARLVNHEGVALGGFNDAGVVLSAERVPTAAQVAADAKAGLSQPAALTASRAQADSTNVTLTQPPPADLEPLLADLKAFATANVTHAGRVASVNGVADTPDLSPTPAPGGTP